MKRHNSNQEYCEIDLSQQCCKECKICRGTEEEDKDLSEEEQLKFEFISPCSCTNWIHRECLNQWRIQDVNGSMDRCEVCLVRYQYENQAEQMLQSRLLKERQLRRYYCVLFTRITMWSVFIETIMIIFSTSSFLFVGDSDWLLLDLVRFMFSFSSLIMQNLFVQHLLIIHLLVFEIVGLFVVMYSILWMCTNTAPSNNHNQYYQSRPIFLLNFPSSSSSSSSFSPSSRSSNSKDKNNACVIIMSILVIIGLLVVSIAGFIYLYQTVKRFKTELWNEQEVQIKRVKNLKAFDNIRFNNNVQQDQQLV
jgi:hypothetical protein